MFQKENCDLRRAPLHGFQPALDLLDLLQSAFGACLADAIVRQCDLAQASTKKMIRTMMCDGRIDKLDVCAIAP
jgi:DNA-binding IclR family transcriptional regulator